MSAADETQRLRQEAHEAVQLILSESPNADAQRFGRATLEHIAALAYLEGRSEGYHVAMRDASSIADNVFGGKS